MVTQQGPTGKMHEGNSSPEKEQNMSWQIINEILGLAATDEQFAQELFTDPVDTVMKRGYHLTPTEQEAFRCSTSETLDKFSQNLLYHLSYKSESLGKKSAPSSE